MFHKLLLAAVCAGVLAVSTVEAKMFDGNELHRFCNKKSPSFGSSYCLGYISGAADAMTDLQQSEVFNDQFKRFCLPIGRVKAGQVVDVVKKYLIDYPERRHSAGTVTILSALREAFPCKK